MMKAASRKLRTNLAYAAIMSVTAVIAWSAGAHIALADNTPQQDYLRKISENISGAGSSSSTTTSDGGAAFSSVDGKHLLAFVALIAGVITILFWWNNRQTKPRKVKTVNHSRKLFKQIGKQMGLAGDEIKQLKVLAEVHERTKGEALENPLTLLLCPSLLTKSMEIGDVKIDRQVIARMAKRISQKPTMS